MPMLGVPNPLTGFVEKRHKPVMESVTLRKVHEEISIIIGICELDDIGISIQYGRKFNNSLPARGG
jgi:hypothetical protein